MKWLYLLKNLPLVILFIASPSKRNIIISDLYSRKDRRRAYPKCITDLATELESRYFRSLFYYRINNFSSKFLKILYGYERTFIIDVNTDLGSGVQLAHPYATILNANSIGENLYVNHLVTVGEIKGEKPTIGNNVQLHANCTVIGGITVGDNAIIGAGAVVAKDVPPGATVIGNPAKIILKNV